MEENANVSGTAPKKRFTIFGVEFVYLYFLGICLSFIGWLIENTTKLITHGVIDSKYHILPFISAYALIVFAVHIFLRDPDDVAVFGKRIFKNKTKGTAVLSNVISWAFSCFFVFISELIVGNLWYSLFGVALWNYTGWIGGVTQFTSLPTTLGFGTGAYLGFKLIYKPALNFVKNKLSYKVAKIICLTLGVAIVLDTAFMVLQLGLFGEAPVYWTLKIDKEIFLWVAIAIVVLAVLTFVFFKIKKVIAKNRALPEGVVREYSYKKLRLVRLVRRLWFFFKGAKYDYKKGQMVDKVTQPSIVLCNHVSYVDFFYAVEYFKTQAPNFIASRYSFYKHFSSEFLRKRGSFPKSMYTVDVESAMNCMRVLKRKGILGMMPEAKLGAVCTLADIHETTYKFIKGAKVDVYYIKLEGGYLAYPRWGNGVRRGALVESTLDILFTKEELEALSVEEIKERTEKALAYNDFEWLKSHPEVKYRSRKLAEGLENILSLCPHCHSKYSLKTKGHRVMCERCGMSAEIDNRYAFVDGKPFENFMEWYNWQTEEMRKEIEANPEFKMESHCVLKHSSKDGKTALRVAGDGVVTYSREGLTYVGTRDGENVELHFPMEKVYRLLFGAGVSFEFYDEREIYYFVPDDTRSCVDWFIASKIMNK